LTRCSGTPEKLSGSDSGEAGAYPLARILTPLIKFRACRDARRVTGDAMEVRGGCGYIEEWADPRLLRDAHLGSIWEGTSNIVALDVVRAIRREGALPVLQQHWQGLLAGTPMHPAARAVFSATLNRVAEVAARVSDAGKAADHQARQAASALYHATTATSMAWEAGRMGCSRRMRLAQWALHARLLPQDPLLLDVQPDWLADLLEPGDGLADVPVDAVQLLG